MKKPNLDNDPKWRIWDGMGKFSVGPKFEDGFTEKCAVEYGHAPEYKEKRRETAEALSAVPEMVDALLEVNEKLAKGMKSGNLSIDEFDGTNEKIKNALDKAGVEI